MRSSKIVKRNSAKNSENLHYCFSAEFRWWKMFPKSLRNLPVWIIKVTIFIISNSDSVGVEKEEKLWLYETHVSFHRIFALKIFWAEANMVSTCSWSISMWPPLCMSMSPWSSWCSSASITSFAHGCFPGKMTTSIKSLWA